MTLRLAQISDCHLSREPALRYRGIDPYRNLERVLQEVRAWSPDLLLATGDLSEDASAEAHAWLAARLAPLAVPVLALPGNHDDPQRLRGHFPLTAVEAPLVHDTAHWRLVLLNSVIAGQIPGRLDERALEALDALLAERACFHLVALHHQPLPTGSAWIDRYPLLEPDGFRNLIGRYPGVRVVTWGHVHQAFDEQHGATHWLSAPSTASNSLPGRARFTPDPAGPGFRWLVLADDGAVETGVVFLGET